LTYPLTCNVSPMLMRTTTEIALAAFIKDGLFFKARAKCGPVPALARRMGRISALPEIQHRFVMQMIETVPPEAGTQSIERGMQ
jgi:hypothetical protein